MTRRLRLLIAVPVWLLALLLPAAAQDRRAPQTDETVAATKGARLVVDNFAGEVVIRAWDRDQVRVQARHSERTQVRIRTSESGISISSTGRAGPVQSVDYEISAPAWMPLKVVGTYNFVTIEGSRAEVAAESVRGDVVVKGGSGGVTAKSVEGEIVLEGVRGRINAQSTNQGITITDAAGDIIAETINGGITMTKVQAGTVDAGTVNGHIRFDGTPAANGRYQFSTHNGNIAVAMPESANATFVVRTYNGRFTSALPVKGEGDVRRGRRVSFTLGTGSAEFVLESFGGVISLHKPGALPAGTTTGR
jgi:hypothetical protein